MIGCSGEEVGGVDGSGVVDGESGKVVFVVVLVGHFLFYFEFFRVVF